jgi:nucleoside 2-deoxyribosyltransferase
MRQLKIYLAGPDVFLPEAIEIGDRKKALCEKHGFIGLFPIDNEVESALPGERIDHLIYRENLAMIRSADLGIFNLTPFRGVSADSGTVFELGVMIGLGKPAFGYSNEDGDLLKRMQQMGLVEFINNAWRDRNGMRVEDFGNADNLMIDVSVALGGHPIVRHAVPQDQRYRDLTGFEECLRMAQASFMSTQSSAPPAARCRAV